MPLYCEIISQDRLVYRGEADMVLLPGTEGEMGILPNHSPLLTTLKDGLIKVRTHGKEEYFTVAGGIAEVNAESVTILAHAAENVAEIDVARAEAAKRRAEELLARGAPVDPDTYLRIEASLRKSNLRLDAVRRYRHGAGKIP